MNQGVNVLRNENGIYRKEFQLSQGLCSAAVTHAFEGKSVGSFHREQASQPPAPGAGAAEASVDRDCRVPGVLTPGSPGGAASAPETGWSQLSRTLALTRCFHTPEPTRSCGTCEQVLLLFYFAHCGPGNQGFLGVDASA